MIKPHPFLVNLLNVGKQKSILGVLTFLNPFANKRHTYVELYASYPSQSMYEWICEHIYSFDMLHKTKSFPHVLKNLDLAFCQSS